MTSGRSSSQSPQPLGRLPIEGESETVDAWGGSLHFALPFVHVSVRSLRAERGKRTVEETGGVAFGALV